VIAAPILPDTTSRIDEAVSRARAAQRAWAATPLRERLRVILSFQKHLYSRADEMAAAISAETGKPRAEALTAEVLVTLDATRFLLKEVPRLLRKERVPHGNLAMKAKRAYLLREPHGVIGIISPWNYPFSIPASEVLAALACGNAVVLKPSEFTPNAALKLQELLIASGLDRDLCHVIPGNGTTGAALVAAPIDKLIFTGSVATGKKISKAAGEKLLPVVLELGGKDAMIVLEDADVDVASSAAVWGAFMNAGQTCLSVERCFVHRNIHQQFVAACVEKAQRLRSVEDVGPLINRQQLAQVEEQLADAVGSGAKIRCGGTMIAERQFAPTIITDVAMGSKLMKQETFGPLLPIVPFESDQDAIRLANDSEFALAASVWTRDNARGEALARRIDAGSVMINDLIAGFGIPEAPHGGFKSSGIGRTHGRLGLEEMVRVKYVDVDLLPRLRKAWWFGYGDDFYLQMRGFVDFLFSPSPLKRLRGGIAALKAFKRSDRV
jgi:acyl-CoA reductase-like NAD-dependent aldehyde dehydrogenase